MQRMHNYACSSAKSVERAPRNQQEPTFDGFDSPEKSFKKSKKVFLKLKKVLKKVLKSFKKVFKKF